MTTGSESGTGEIDTTVAAAGRITALRWNSLIPKPSQARTSLRSPPHSVWNFCPGSASMRP